MPMAVARPSSWSRHHRGTCRGQWRSSVVSAARQRAGCSRISSIQQGNHSGAEVAPRSSRPPCVRRDNEHRLCRTAKKAASASDHPCEFNRAAIANTLLYSQTQPNRDARIAGGHHNVTCLKTM
ncbi:hypothetical protein CHELA1G11_13587 [Hyphomicrobiales bacterium]|nr:hypothetical protein CHELA1G2_10727 [Hyphomicrobiales bacterium]CAH1672720.1 hypothetical protein CHELA1G11_13587 [Hyphomicrobiales bacterium]